jgi:tRNA-specific adenosine deaminase 1
MEALRLAGFLGGAAVMGEALRKRKYAELKGSDELHERIKVKQDIRKALKGWVRNTGDEGFSIEPPPSTS